jgi:hypothetical protein
VKVGSSAGESGGILRFDLKKEQKLIYVFCFVFTVSASAAGSAFDDPTNVSFWNLRKCSW